MTKGSGDARMQPFLEGRKKDSTFYPVIYGAEMDEDWTDPKVWKKANPSLGETIGMDKVKAACESARQNPGEENSFRQLRLNQWVKQAVRWMPMEKWDACDSLLIRKNWKDGYVMEDLTFPVSQTLPAFVWCFHRKMKASHIIFCHITGSRKKPCRFE